MRHLSAFALTAVLPLAAGCATTSSWPPLIGFHAGTPANYSVAVGVARVLTRTIDSTAFRAHTDLDAFALAEPGWNAGRISVGIGSDHERRITKTLVNARVTALRRWRGASTGNYAGVELEAETIERLALGLRVGLFAPVASPNGHRPLLFTIDFPVGW